MKSLFSTAALVALLVASPAMAASIPTTNLEVWLDADTLSGSTGDAIPTWSDAYTSEGGTGADNAVAYTPLNPLTQPALRVGSYSGHNAVRFTPSTALRNNTIASMTDMTVFMVYQWNAMIGYQYPLSFGSFDPNIGIANPNQPLTIYDSGYHTYSTLGSQAANHLYRLTYARTGNDNRLTLEDGSTQNLNFASGATAASYELNGQTYSSIDGAAYIDIAEIIIYRAALGPGDIALVQNYLTNKFAPTPEPSSVFMLIAGVIGAARVRKRRQ